MKRLLSSRFVVLSAAIVSAAALTFTAGAEPRLRLHPAADAGNAVPSGVSRPFDPAVRFDKVCEDMFMACNTTVNSVLDNTDCPGPVETFIDFWVFQGAPGMQVTVNLTSNEFDTWAYLVSPTPFRILADNDDVEPGNTNSFIMESLDEGGPWSVGANGFSPQDLGNYTIQLECVGGTFTIPAAPSGLTATALTETDVELDWNDNSNNENVFLVEFREQGGVFAPLGAVSTNTTRVDVENLDPGTTYDFRVQASNDVGDSPFSNVATATTVGDPTMCVAGDTTVCLLDDRFRVEIDWKNFEGVTGQAMVVPFGSADSGLFYFFDADNWEMLVKMVDACGAPFNSFWVFAAATTNVEYTLRVTDTQEGVSREYFNPLGTAAPAITDTAAFLTCP